MNYKNLLQEHCQKYKYDIPVYTTKLIGGLTHAPEWQSSVLVKAITIANDIVYASKKEAEQAVAKLAYEQIVMNVKRSLIKEKHAEPIQKEVVKESVNEPIMQESDTTQEDKTNQMYIFVDLENIQPVFEYIPNNVHIHCFMSKFSSIDTKLYLDCTMHITDLNTKNAADYLLTLTVGNMLHKINRTDKIYIVSRDKDIANIQYILESWNYNIKHITKSIDIVKIVQDSRDWSR
jgi:hypothetical protein